MTHLPQSDNSPLPQPDPRSESHWEGLARGVLVLRRCGVCGALNHPIADECRLCESPQLVWDEVAPGVRLYSWTVEERSVIQGMIPPYVVAQVTPAECEDGAVRLIGTLIGDPADLELGMLLTLCPRAVPASDVVIATYVPA